MSAAPKISVRESMPSDRAAIERLLSERDETRHAPEHVHNALFHLNPQLFRAWLAFAGDRPVGITALYVRDVAHEGQERRAGYWSHLYVDPEHRKLMLYPQLVTRMMRESSAAGPGGGAALDFLYTGTRRPDVAEAHVRIGFGLCGFLTVRAKPLRPGGLIAKHKGLGRGVALAAAPLDALYGAWIGVTRVAAPQGVEIEPFGLDCAELLEVSRLLNAARGPRFAQHWTPARLRERFTGAIDGHRYSFLAAKRGRDVVGGCVFRMAERGAAIRVGVVMDVVAQGGDAGVQRALLSEAERVAHAQGADVMILLDGAGEPDSATFARSGYRATGERYQMTAWPRSRCEPGSWTANLANWRFVFADHDAF